MLGSWGPHPPIHFGPSGFPDHQARLGAFVTRTWPAS